MLTVEGKAEAVEDCGVIKNFTKKKVSARESDCMR
jgi:hypothetical protein